MTAIEKYTRLEALGQWREVPDQSPREVVVSFGNASLVLSELNENPLCHWAMAATCRLSLDGSKAIYTPDTEGFETLEIDDAEMVEAIAQVSRAVVATERKTSWFHWVFLAMATAAIGSAFYATPSLLRGQAARMTGPESARKLGSDMVTTLGIDICRAPRADVVRELFQSRVFLESRALLLIARHQQHSSVFPGGIVVIGGDALQAMRTPNDLADLTTTLLAQSDLALEKLFEGSSTRELFEYITSGKLADERLAQAAQNITDSPEINDVAEFTSTIQPLLRDQDWVTLQGICLE
ncbi:hypothetical protein A9Q96_16315 [Rhodobacterales bacterium 52_120_T64]|nr:hypothetical protein A9Q96_16315 [Rhodobacterales bacterium 52_120_T64]